MTVSIINVFNVSIKHELLFIRTLVELCPMVICPYGTAAVTSGTPNRLIFHVTSWSFCLFVTSCTSYQCPTILSALARTMSKMAAHVCLQYPEGFRPVFTFLKTITHYTCKPQYLHSLSERWVSQWEREDRAFCDRAVVSFYPPFVELISLSYPAIDLHIEPCWRIIFLTLFICCRERRFHQTSSFFIYWIYFSVLVSFYTILVLFPIKWRNATSELLRLHTCVCVCV